MKHRNHAPVIYQAIQFGEPVRVRPELQEDFPAHADMLRYDNGFHSPADPALVIFPLFKHKTDGSYPDRLTIPRWNSFSIRLDAPMDQGQCYDYIAEHPVGDWITYQHPEGQHFGFESINLNRWLETHPKHKINGWRSL